MRAEVLAFCREEALFERGDRVACAVSGGADSMALLCCLHSLREELGIELSVAHFNHLLRKEASDADESFVKAFCEARNIPFFSGRGDVAAHAVAQGFGLEEAARELRYAFLEGLPCDKVALAHHADDNGETVLLHLLRGSGLRGLRGMLPKRGKLVRPLLSVSRSQILEYLRAEKIPWREDESNRSDFCRRNRLRHSVMPILREEEPALAEKITAQSRLLREEDEFLDGLAHALLEKAQRQQGWDCKTLLAAPAVLQRRALRLMTQKELPKDVSRSHIEALQGLLSAPSPSAEVSLPNEVTARRSYGVLLLAREERGKIQPRSLKIPGVTELPEAGIKISCAIAENFENFANTPFHFAVKYDMIAESILRVRARGEKDRFVMADGHSKSLKKLFIERKIPRYLRRSLPVITQGEEILAVGGIGVSRRYAACAGEPALIIHIETKGDVVCFKTLKEF